MLNTDTVWRGREDEGHQRERGRLSELWRGDESMNEGKELFDLWKHDIVIPSHIGF